MLKEKDKIAKKPDIHNTIANASVRLRRHLGFLYLGSHVLGIDQQLRSPISMASTCNIIPVFKRGAFKDVR